MINLQTCNKATTTYLGHEEGEGDVAHNGDQGEDCKPDFIQHEQHTTDEEELNEGGHDAEQQHWQNRADQKRLMELIIWIDVKI